MQLAAAYRVFDRLGWTELIYNPISLRVPDEPGHFLLNPFGLHCAEVWASNLVKVDGHGNTVGDSPWPINPAAFSFHSAILQALPDAHCVMQGHTTATMAVCCRDDGLSFTNFYAAQLYGKVAYTTSRASRCMSRRVSASWPARAANRRCCCTTTGRWQSGSAWPMPSA